MLQTTEPSSQSSTLFFKLKVQWDTTSQSLGCPLSKKQKITSVVKDVKTLKPLYTVNGNVKWYSMVGPRKIKNRITIWSTILGVYSIKSRVTRNLYTHVHSNIIHNSQKAETTQMSMNRWMDKQIVAYAYNEILFTLKKDEHSDTCYNMNKPWGHYAKWNKPVTKRHILYDST